MFLLPVFTRLGHECRDMLSPCYESGSFACVHRLGLDFYSHLKEFLGNRVRTHVNYKRKIPSTGKFSSEEDRTHDAASHSDSEADTLPMSYSGLASSNKTVSGQLQTSVLHSKGVNLGLILMSVVAPLSLFPCLLEVNCASKTLT